MAYTVRDYNNDVPDDPALLAAMFNDFDSVWPGGFTRGVPETAERMQTRYSRSERLAVLVVDDGTEFAGYCDLKADQGESEVAYIPLLGARPAHHGKGVGKTLLQEMVRRVTEKGFRELTLHTWAGNLKAVPLYKKTGFNWVPETQVFMRNFIPSCLLHPVGKVFFAHRDWYQVFERDLTVAPDDVKWQGMKVFPYRFRDGDDFVHFTFDATSGGLTALETPDYFVGCRVPVEEATAGETIPITWEITSRNGKPLEVLLMTEADSGLDLRVLERFIVETETVLIRDLKIGANVRPVRRGDKQRRIRSTLLINGQPILLETGVNVVLPVEIQYAGQSLFMGRENKIEVLLWSHLDRPLTGTLTLDAHPALTCPLPAQSFTLPPRMKTQCVFTLTASESGALPTTLHFVAEGVTGSRPVVFRALSGTTPIASLEPEVTEEAILEIPGLRVEAHLRAGWLHMQSTSLDTGIGAMSMPELGPPFVMWRDKPLLYPTRLETRDGEACLVQSGPSSEFPGLIVERTVTLVSNTLVRVMHRVQNTASFAQKTQLQLRAFRHLGDYIVVPYAEGIVREPSLDWEHFPSGETDLLSPERQPAESWLAGESKTSVFGLIWQGAPEVESSWNIQLRYDLGEIPANGAVDLPPLYLVGGPGNWEMVRSWWRQLVQPSGIQERYTPEPHRVLEMGFVPNPALLTADTTETMLSIRNRRGTPQSGEVKVAGDTFGMEPPAFTLEGVHWKQDASFPVCLTAPAQPSASQLMASLETPTAAQKYVLPVIRVSTGDYLAVEQAGEDIFLVRNGLITLRVVPKFLGSVIALETEGVNHLLSAYPTSCPFVWANPWFGGIHPFMGWMGDVRLSRERFSGESVQRTGERGLVWEGIKVTCQPEHKELRWLRVEAEYLTLPGSNLVALVSRWINQAPTRMWLPGDGGIAVWCQPGGSRDKSVMHWKREQERRYRLRGGFPQDARSDAWGAVSNAETQDTLLLVASDPHCKVGVEDFGNEGPHLVTSAQVGFDPGETREILSWLIVTRDLEQADAYASLAKVRSLP